MMFDPLANLSGLLNMLFGILGETLAALLLPVTTLIVTPLLSLLALFM
jgi:hypothetical protein